MRRGNGTPKKELLILKIFVWAVMAYLIFLVVFMIGREILIQDFYTKDGVKLRLLKGKEGYAVVAASGDEVVLPDSYDGLPIVKIDPEAFYERPFQEYKPLKSIVLPETITSIGYEAFHGCRLLERINIPDSVTYIGDDAFSGCSKLSYIPIPKAMTVIGEYAFSSSGIVTADIPENITTIEEYAFSWCKNLTSVTIDNSVTVMEKRAFWNCENLTEIRFDGTTVEWNAMQRSKSWNEDVPATEVICLDGSIAL